MTTAKTHSSSKCVCSWNLDVSRRVRNDWRAWKASFHSTLVLLENRVQLLTPDPRHLGLGWTEMTMVVLRTKWNRRSEKGRKRTKVWGEFSEVQLYGYIVNPFNKCLLGSTVLNVIARKKKKNNQRTLDVMWRSMNNDNVHGKYRNILCVGEMLRE